MKFEMKLIKCGNCGNKWESEKILKQVLNGVPVENADKPKKCPNCNRELEAVGCEVVDYSTE